MKSNKVFIQYLYSSGNYIAERVNLNLILSEFDRYKMQSYDEWMEDDILEMPRDLFEITHVYFNESMQLEEIEFTEKTYNDKR